MKTLLKELKKTIKASFWSKIGALFMKKTFKTLKGKFDYSQYGGAVLLGCKKLVVKGHGSSTADSICACIDQVFKMHTGKLIEKITTSLENSGIASDEEVTK